MTLLLDRSHRINPQNDPQNEFPGVKIIGDQERHENSRAKAVTQHSHNQHPDQRWCS